MGMCATSWDGWAKLHVNPCVAMGYYFVASVPACMIPAYLCTGVRGEGLLYDVILVPLAVYTAVGAAIIISVWRWGPGFMHHKLYQPVVAFASIGIVPVTYAGYLGPEATIPWHSRLHFLVVYCGIAFAGL